MNHPRLPLEPFLAITGLELAVTTWNQATGNLYRGESSYAVASPVTTASQFLGVSRRTVCRWSVAGIPLRAAEDACDVLGFHPCEVWGDAWIDACLQ